jgi:hypothetical protein
LYFALSTALSVFSSDLWLQGKKVQHGLRVSAGLFIWQKKMQPPSTSSQTICYSFKADIDTANPVPIDDITA